MIRAYHGRLVRRTRSGITVQTTIGIIIGAVIMIGLFGGTLGLVTGDPLKQIRQTTGKDAIERFAEKAEHGCKIGESNPRSFTHTFDEGVKLSSIEAGNAGYQGQVTNNRGIVEVDPLYCDSVKICSSGEGPDCSGGGSIGLGSRDVTVDVWYDFQGGEQVIIKQTG